MTKQDVINTLTTFNEWRRGSEIEMLKPKLIGEAIDEAVNLLSKESKQDLRNRVYFEMRNGKKKK